MKTLHDDIGGQRPGPARVGAREQERPGQLWMAAVELECESRAERATEHMGPPEVERVDQLREAVGVPVQPECLGRIRRLATAGRIPGDDRELVGEVLDLPAPLAAVADTAVQQHERWAFAGPLVCDPKIADLDVLHPQKYVRRLPAPACDDAAVEQRLSLVTLGVADIPRARAFYEALGWETRAEPDDDVVFFQSGGMIVALWSRAELAADSGVEDTGGWGGITLAHNVRSPAEVDAVIEEARRAGAQIPREGAETFWGGYSGAFVDPDGHPWEVAHNPHWTIADDGATRLPD